MQASYTWSHSLDEVSNGGVLEPYNGLPACNYQINPFCLRCSNYGNADYDIRNSFNASYVWNTPFKFSNKYRQRCVWWLDHVAELLRPLGTAFDGSGQHARASATTTGNAPYFPAEVLGNGTGSL